MRKGTLIQYSFLPEKFAIVGKYLNINNEDGWEVLWVSNYSMELDRLDYIRESRKDRMSAIK